MDLGRPDKLALLQKAADIAIHAAGAGGYGPELIVELLDKSYKKLIALAKED